MGRHRFTRDAFFAYPAGIGLMLYGLPGYGLTLAYIKPSIHWQQRRIEIEFGAF